MKIENLWTYVIWLLCYHLSFLSVNCSIYAVAMSWCLSALASAHSLEMMNSATSSTALPIGWTSAYLMCATTISALVTFLLLLYFLLHCSVAHVFVWHQTLCFLFLHLLLLLYELCVSALLAQYITYSLVLSFAFWITVSFFFSPVITSLSFMPFMSSSFIFLFHYTHIHWLLFWGVPSILHSSFCCHVSLHYWNDNIISLYWGLDLSLNI